MADIDLAPFVLENVKELESEEKKGSGSYGAVYRVTVNGVVCIDKRLHDILVSPEVPRRQRESIREKFRAECVILSKLRHPHIVHFVGVRRGPNLSDLSLVMECLHTDLAKFLDEHQEIGVNIPLSIKLSILLDVSYGLLYLHTFMPPIIHRDLSANNILLTADGLKAKIADLGVSKLLDIQTQAKISQTIMPGSQNYMPPEALTENPQYGLKLDIFSFGHLILYTTTQEFPGVHEVTPTPANIEQGTIQIMKRRRAIDQMGGERHCLHPLVTQCLQDRPEQRPTTLKLNESLKEHCTEHPRTVAEVLQLASEAEKGQIYRDVFESERSDQEVTHAEFVDLQKKYTQDVEELKAELAQKEEDLQQHVDSLTEVEQVYQMRDKEMKRLLEEASKNQQEMQTKTSQVKQYKEQVDTLKNQLTERDGNNKELAKERDKLLRELKQTRKELEKAETKVKEKDVKKMKKKAKKKLSDKGATSPEPTEVSKTLEEKVAEKDQLYETELKEIESQLDEQSPIYPIPTSPRRSLSYSEIDRRKDTKLQFTPRLAVMTSSLLKSEVRRFVSSLTQTKQTQDRLEQPPAAENLELKAFRHLYGQYVHIQNLSEKEKQLYKLLPLFCKSCENLKSQELVTNFPEAFVFAEDVASLFVRRVTQLAQSMRGGVVLLKYFEVGEDAQTEETGLMILKVVHILANGPDLLVSAMMMSNLSAILVRCIYLFLDLPPPLRLHERSQGESKSHSPVQLSVPRVKVGEDDGEGNREMRQRTSLEKHIRSLLNCLMRNLSAVEALLRSGDLSLLFDAISSPCPSYNKIWRKLAADCLMLICRHNLTADVVTFIHSKGCIELCIRNIKLAIDQPPLELVKIFATIFCCLKDSSDLSQVLLDDFSACGGYTFLREYLLHLEKTGTDEAWEAGRNMVLLMQNLVLVGCLPLEPTLSDRGKFQDSDFIIPTPVGDGYSVKNSEAFLFLRDTYLNSQSSHLGKVVVDAILNIFRSDPANYFIMASHHSLPMFVEKLPSKNDDVQAHTFLLLEYVVMELSYVPIPELTSVGLLLQQREHPKLLTLSVNFLLKLISFNAKYSTIFREVGILTMLMNVLKDYAAELKEEGKYLECAFLFMERLRATIEANTQNGQ